MRFIAKLGEQKYRKAKTQTDKANKEYLHQKFVGGLSWATYQQETKLNDGETLTALTRACQASNEADKAYLKFTKSRLKEHKAFRHWMNAWQP